MISKNQLATLMLCAAALSNAAQAQPAAAHQDTAKTQRQAAARQPEPLPAPTQEPVQYQLLLASSMLLVLFGRRGAVRAQPWSNT